MAIGMLSMAPGVFKPSARPEMIGWWLSWFTSCSLVAGISFCWVSSVSRKLTFSLLLMFLLTLYYPNYLVWWLAPEHFFEMFELQMMFLVFAAWGVIGLGLICIEQRAGDRVPESSFHTTVFSPKIVLSRILASFVFGCGVAAILGLGIFGTPLWFDQCASTWWPVAEAVLVEPAEPNEKWLNYTYQVDGVEYFGSREVTFLEPKFNFSVHGSAAERLVELKSQSVFPVSYNPNSPGESLLEPGASNLFIMSVWTSCCCLAFLPLGFRSLRNTYSGVSIFKGMANECTMLEFVVMLMMLAGIALRLFSWGGLVLGFEGEYVAAILLVIAIGWVYRQSKKFAQELQATNGLTTVAG